MGDPIKRFAAAMATAFALLALAPAASADYLYDIWKGQEHAKPYVMVILDTSGSMEATDAIGETCPYGFRDDNSNGVRDQYCTDWDHDHRECDGSWRLEPCKQRIDAAKDVMTSSLQSISSDVGLGLMTFVTSSDSAERPPGGSNNCSARVVAPVPSPYSTIVSAIGAISAGGSTPLEWSLIRAHRQLQTIRNDEAAGCRDYYVILLTDGEDRCAAGDTDNARAEKVLAQVQALRADGIRTFVIGFGGDLVDTNGTSNLSKYARAGGTALSAGQFVCWNNPDCSDTSARAMFAYASNELDEALTRAFDEVRTGVFSAAEPIIASVPLRRSEVDRVARNLMIYSAFDKEGDRTRGHLYGIRLFQESTEFSGEWQFTDLSDVRAVLEDCGPGKPCIFDAGRMLKNRTTPRKIFTGRPASTPITANGEFTLPIESVQALTVGGAATELGSVWTAMRSLQPIASALEDAQPPAGVAPTMLRNPTDDRLVEVVRWLHGETRQWPLGDIYHGSATVVEPPSYEYLDRGYPQFRQNNQDRPWMIYTGANDGMIHAFYASPDIARPDDPRWQPGEEAWAYLPANMIGRALAEVSASRDRFFSQDLSCRYTDVIVDGKVKSNGELDCDGAETNCGWATVLLCGQGWGGSWYVAIDVTDPATPRPLWEMTIPASSATHRDGLGRTWSVPAVSLLNFDGKPTWAAVFGNGYNSDMHDCPSFDTTTKTCTGSATKRSYRMLNLPFAGAYPEYGDGADGDSGHAFVVNVATGALIKRLHLHDDTHDPRAIVADVAAVDSDGNGMIDAAYLGGWDGSLLRAYFGDTKTDDESAIDACVGDNALARISTGGPIGTNPSVVSHPYLKNKVLLFLGAGIDAGNGPDQLRLGDDATWEFRAYRFDDDGSRTCVKVPEASNLCTADDWNLSEGTRLLGQPLLSRQHSGRDWLVYTSWTPTETNSCGGSGEARLWCLDVTMPDACVPCEGLDGAVAGGGGDDEDPPPRSVEITLASGVPTSPVMADGHVYFGPMRSPIEGSEANAARPNAQRPRTITVSWREIFR